MIILRKEHRVLVQGITGKQGTFWTELMQAYGTNVVGGVNPKKAGTEHCGVPVFASAVDAMKEVEFDASILFIPPLGVKDAALDAIEAGAKNLCILTEHIPVQDVMYIMAARGAETHITGPNTAGSVTIGECFQGFMPAFNERIFKKGSVGVISRSGSLGTLMCQNIVSAGYGQSAFVGIGGDPIIGTTTRDALEALDGFEGTDAVVMVGEIGGTMEEEAAEYAATMSKPVIAFIAGGAAPKGKKMGHAGAIVMGDRGTYASKKQALEAAGVTVLATPSHVGDALKESL
ncbi:MAG: succinyl-CoA synthetase subunit alpha [Alphaproteobacteria bacterium]|nr:succinyl-CoA synthetase subunit alpha [Alphaproteobacteria bacterium]